MNVGGVKCWWSKITDSNDSLRSMLAKIETHSKYLGLINCGNLRNFSASFSSTYFCAHDKHVAKDVAKQVAKHIAKHIANNIATQKTDRHGLLNWPTTSISHFRKNAVSMLNFHRHCHYFLIHVSCRDRVYCLLFVAVVLYCRLMLLVHVMLLLHVVVTRCCFTL